MLRHVHPRCLTRDCLVMQIMRTPDGEWLLYSCACCATDQYDVSSGCRGCHKGQCGPAPCSRPSALPPLPAGNVTLWRRERPKMLFDRHGRPTHLFVSQHVRRRALATHISRADELCLIVRSSAELGGSGQCRDQQGLDAVAAVHDGHRDPAVLAS